MTSPFSHFDFYTTICLARDFPLLLRTIPSFLSCSIAITLGVLCVCVGIIALLISHLCRAIRAQPTTTTKNRENRTEPRNFYVRKVAGSS